MIVLVLALVIAVALATSAAASIYVGNTRSVGYGVRADISTPRTAPWVGSTGQSNWVSVGGGGYWVQTGWRYYGGYTYPKSYWEYNLAIGHHLEEMSSQVWNFTRNYEVTHLSSGVWTVKVNGVAKGSWGYLSAPSYSVQALSESHYPTVELNTQFNNVQYRGTTTWFLFNENGWVMESPYWLDISTLYKYRTAGP